MPKVLVLFDGEFVPPSTLRGADLHLFPLTDDRRVINLAKERCAALGSVAEVLEASRLVDTQVSCLRARVLDWSADLGQRSGAQAPISEQLLLPGGEVSAWWFSALF